MEAQRSKRWTKSDAACEERSLLACSYVFCFVLFCVFVTCQARVKKAFPKAVMGCGNVNGYGDGGDSGS